MSLPDPLGLRWFGIFTAPLLIGVAAELVFGYVVYLYTMLAWGVVCQIMLITSMRSPRVMRWLRGRWC